LESIGGALIQLKRIAFTAIFMWLTACASTGYIAPILSTDIDYQKDLKMKIKIWDGKKWQPHKTIIGMGVVTQSRGYKIRIEPPGRADMITVLSCHREWKTPNPKRHGGWFSKRFYEFEVWPTMLHEVKKTCPFDAGVYEKNKGRHAWGLVAIDSEREKLPATVMCNGETTKFGGTSVCQAKKGLIQSIHFNRNVISTKVVGCEIRVPKDKRNWVFLMPPGECTIFFVDEQNADNFHKMVTFGYDSIPIRGVE